MYINIKQEFIALVPAPSPMSAGVTGKLKISQATFICFAFASEICIFAVSCKPGSGMKPKRLHNSKKQLSFITLKHKWPCFMVEPIMSLDEYVLLEILLVTRARTAMAKE